MPVTLPEPPQIAIKTANSAPRFALVELSTALFAMADRTLLDPLGRAITLLDSTWYGHILKGHPEVRHSRRLVEAALVSPLEIRASRGDAD